MRVVIIIISMFVFCMAGTISLTFSDGHKSHIKIAQLMRVYSINATFYINTANLEFKEYFLNVFDVNEIVAWEFEIGGHTVNHKDLTDPKLSTTTILEEICRDRARLIANKWIPKSFAYPYGRNNALSRQLIKECGYNSAMTEKQQNITSSINIQGISIGDIDVGYDYNSIISKIQSGQGWVILNFHNISEASVDEFEIFLGWVKNNNSSNIRSIDGVLGGPFVGLPIEFGNTLPTYIPDRRAQLKIYIGLGCIFILLCVVVYVLGTTQLKRKKKMIFCC